MASPLSTPGTPRTSSPLTLEDDAAQSLSSSPDHVHTTATHRDSDDAWQCHLAVPNAAGASTTVEPVKAAAQAKEKVTRGPLRLLDLPVDILKEIIHQVRLARAPAVSRTSHGTVS